MKKIRCKRVRKFSKKNLKIRIIVKLLTICYLLLLGTNYLSSNTNAYFNDDSLVSGKFQVGTWENDWDRSSLKFSISKDQFFESCNLKEISTAIVNTGSDMKGPTQYEVYYINKGNPKDGEKVGEGILEPILANHSSIIKFTSTKPGNYNFRAFQRPNHAFKAERQDIWSKTITITCTTKINKDTQQDQQNLNQDQTQPSQNINTSGSESPEPKGTDTTQTSETYLPNGDLNLTEITPEESNKNP